MQAPSPGIYRRHEIPYVEHLMSYQGDLIKDFLAFHDDWYDLDQPLKNVHVNNFDGDINERLSYPDAWKTSWFRYETKPGGEVIVNTEHLAKFPTATKIMQELEGQIGHFSYSIMEPNTVISRHTGPENRTGEYLRVHIPLIVPSGDVFFEVNGEEIDWSEPFGFNNQYTHSAHNYTDQRRLILLIDIKRSFLGLPPCFPYYSREHLQFMSKVPPFVRQSKGADNG
jgi:hypothetical protein